MRKQVIAGFGLGLYLAATSVSGSEPVAVVEIRSFAFHPQTLTVKVGTTVRWENHEKRQYHNVWFDSLGEPKPDYFFPGESYERTFDQPGEFPYRCSPHPEMTGAVLVVE